MNKDTSFLNYKILDKRYLQIFNNTINTRKQPLRIFRHFQLCLQTDNPLKLTAF
jgi:hypothetical protein